MAQMDWSYMPTGPDEPGPAGVWDCLDRLTAPSGRNAAPSQRGFCSSLVNASVSVAADVGYLDTAAGILWRVGSGRV